MSDDASTPQAPLALPVAAVEDGSGAGDAAGSEAIAASSTDSAGGEPKPEVEIVQLSADEPNPFEVLGFDLADGRTLTIDDFMKVPTATVKWADLTPAQRRAYEQVGFDPSGQKHSEIRSMKLLDGTAETHWADLTQEQREAAMELGCDANGVRHEMGRLATIANRLLLKDPEIKRKKWDVLTPAQQAAATMLGHDNGGKIWNVRVEREWCENGVSPQSSLQNPFALPKGADSLLRIARNMGIEIVGADDPTATGVAPRLKDVCVDTDEDVIAATRLLPTAAAAAVPTAEKGEGAEPSPGVAADEAGEAGDKTTTKAPAARTADAGVEVAIYATPETRFDPAGMTVSDIVSRSTKLEITVTEAGTIGMRWEDSESGIVAGVTEGQPAHRLGVRPGCRVVAVQGQWVEPREAFDVLMDHVTERPFTVKFKLPRTSE